jgi:hypothetical protein
VPPELLALIVRQVYPELKVNEDCLALRVKEDFPALPDHLAKKVILGHQDGQDLTADLDPKETGATLAHLVSRDHLV